MPTFVDVSTYIAAQLPVQQLPLERLRRLIQRIAPAVTESIQWNLPTFEDHGVLVSLAARKGFIAVYFSPDFPQERVEALGLDCGKSCLRLKNTAPLPEDKLEDLFRDALKWNQTRSSVGAS